MTSDLGINPQPTTKRGIQEHNPKIPAITKKKRIISTCCPIKFKEEGNLLGTIYEKVDALKEWIEKISCPIGRLRDDTNTIRTRTKKDINLYLGGSHGIQFF